MDQNEMARQLSSFLLKNGSNSILITQFEIVKYQDSGDNYVLIGMNEARDISVGVSLIAENGKLYEAAGVNGGGSTCVCSGCHVGCHPVKSADTYWGCIPGFASPPGCTKTETASSSYVFSL